MNLVNFVSCLVLIRNLSATYISFALEIPKTQKSCLSEWFPSQESIAVNYRLLVPDKKPGNDFQVITDPNAKEYQFFDLEFYS